MSSCYQFSDYLLDAANRELSRGGQPVTLAPKAFEVLLQLVRHSGKLLDKAALMAAVWPDAAVEENSLARAVADIRKALGEGPRDNRFIATVARHGYRFRPEVTTLPSGAEREFRPWSGYAASKTNATRCSAVAVLPFSWLTAEGSDSPLSVGMADAVITRLSNLPQFVVRPTSAVLRYANSAQDPAVTAKELGVDFVVSGSIQQAAEHVRVTVQLLSADRQRSGWADSFDEKFTHLFAIEDSISQRVAAALAWQLTNTPAELPARPHTESDEAYRLHLRGRYFLSKRTFAAASKAIEYFERALQLDPRSAPPWSGIADAKILIGLHGALTGWLPPRQTYPEAKRAALRSIELQPDLAEAHASLGFVSFFYDWDWYAAQREFQQAISLQPHYANAHAWYGMMCCFLGRGEEALEAMGTALQLEPFSQILNANRAYILYFARRYREALEQLQESLEMDSSFPATHHRLGLVYAATGMHREAIEHFGQARKLSEDSPQPIGALGYAYGLSGDTRRAEEILALLVDMSKRRYVSAAILAEVCVGLRRMDEALEWLEAAVRERTAAIVRLRVDPRFDELRSNPRFRRIVEQVRIPAGNPGADSGF